MTYAPASEPATPTAIEAQTATSGDPIPISPRAARKPAALERACEVFNRYGAATTFVCRMVPAIRQLISIPAGIARMPLGAFTLFTALGAGVWTAVLAVVGYGLGKSAGDITYLELCTKGKEMAASHLPLVIGGALVLVAVYVSASKLAMGRGRAK